MASRPSGVYGKNEFSIPNPDYDIALVVEGNKLYVNKTVLSFASPVFKTMFHGDFKEKTATEIDLPDKMYTDIVEFLRCIFPSVMKPVDEKNVDKVLPLADEYQVEPLKVQCKIFVRNTLRLKKLTNNQLVHYMVLCDRYEWKSLLSECIELGYYRKFKSLKILAEYDALGTETKYNLVVGRLIKIENLVLDLCKSLGRESSKTLVEQVIAEECKDEFCFTPHTTQEGKFCKECRSSALSKLISLDKKIAEFSKFI